MDESILDELIPLPTLEELKAQKVAELQKVDFIVTKFSSGGVFNTMLMVVLQVYLDLLGLLRTVLGSMFLTCAEGAWLDVKAMDYSKVRKEAVKTRGHITLTRTAPGEAVKIPKGHIFKTPRDLNGAELRFVVTEEVILPKDKTDMLVLVEAEAPGTQYNLPPGQVCRSLTHLTGNISITNGQGWMLREGSDCEDDEGLRSRALRSWSELARVPIRDTYKNACESVPGVLYVTVNDHHPRGQGTIDIIVTSTAGAASPELLQMIKEVCDTIRAPDDNVLVKNSETVTLPIALTVTLPAAMDDSGIAERIKVSVADLLRIQKNRALNELIHADIIFKVKSQLPAVRNVIVTQPATDLILEADKVILLGNILVTIEEV